MTPTPFGSDLNLGVRKLTPEERAQVILLFKRVITPELIEWFRNRARERGLGPYLNLVVQIGRAGGDTFLSQFDRETGDPFEGMSDNSTVQGPIDLPIVFMMYDSDPEHRTYSGLMNEKDKPMLF